jgi:hypothetical protein
MAKFLTKDIADALCTVITLGFIKYNTRPELTGNQKTLFQYSKTTEENMENHKFFTRFIKKFGIELSVDEAEPQGTMPCIIAKTKKVPNSVSAKNIVQDFWPYITTIDSGARDEDTAPSGAYIGGMATIGTVNIIGPSTLIPYTPVYREVPGDSNGNYSSAKKEIETAAKILKEHPPTVSGRSVKISLDCKCCDSLPATIEAGKSFKSYHGMIRAMMEEYPPNSDDACAYFEIALGVNTGKVSSCIPCSIFMSANDMAATSTHFGRGDNWAVPDFTSAAKSLQTRLKEAWIKAVNSHYTEGLTLCLNASSAISKIETIKKMDAAIKKELKPNPLENREVIPNIFLEALTFQGPFLEKMAATLNFSCRKK